MSKMPSVIKGTDGDTRKGVRVKPLELTDLVLEAKRVVDEARADAEKLLADAKVESERIKVDTRAEAYRIGYEEGKREGHEAGRAEAFKAASETFARQQESLIESCKQTIAAVNKDREAWNAAARQDLVDLAMAIAERVVFGVGEREREAVRANLEEAVRLAGARTDVTISVHPLDAETAGMFAKSLIDAREQWQSIQVTEDASVSPGGCRVQWGSGAIDATLETQLDRIRASICRPDSGAEHSESGEGS